MWVKGVEPSNLAALHPKLSIFLIKRKQINLFTMTYMFSWFSLKSFNIRWNQCLLYLWCTWFDFRWKSGSTMSASAKITLRKKTNAVGQYPLALRITLNRRSSYKLIGHCIDPEDWDDVKKEVKKSHPNSDNINTLLASKLTESKKELINLRTVGKEYSANQIKEEIYKPTSGLSFFDHT